MLRVSDLLMEHRELDTFAELVEVVRSRAGDEMFFRMDLKPPYHDTPDDWESALEAAFTGYRPDARQ